VSKMPSYPNERDCEHGSMRGKCDTCDLIQAEKQMAECEGCLNGLISYVKDFGTDVDPKVLLGELGEAKLRLNGEYIQ